MTQSAQARPTIDSSRPQIARVYDYYLGGRDWYLVDQRMAEEARAIFPAINEAARANRAFMRRAVRTLAAEHGMRQWIDLGTGLPAEPDLHQVAQGIAPDSRVVYVDCDPLVLEYAEVLRRSSEAGRTAVVGADLRCDGLLDSPEVLDVIDLSQPVVLSVLAVLHFLTDEDDPYGCVQRLMDRLAPGSHLLLSHVSLDFDPETMGRMAAVYREAGIPVALRSKEELQRFFDGLELLEPGITSASRWRPDGDPELPDSQACFYAAVARKP